MIDEQAIQRVKNHYESDMEILEMARPFRKLGLYLFSLRLPIKWIKSLVISALRKIMPVWGNKLSAKFIKSFYSLYFKYHGISYYWAQEDPPEQTKRPYIIFTMRYDIMSPCVFILNTPHHNDSPFFQLLFFIQKKLS